MRKFAFTGLTLSLFLVSTATAQSPGEFFFEDFADDNLQDYDPAFLTTGVWQGGQALVENGDLIIEFITGLDVLFPQNPDGLSAYYEDVSIRTQVRLDEFGDEWAHFGLLGRTQLQQSYFGGIGIDRGNVPSVVDGSPYLYFGESRSVEDFQSELIATDLDPTETDVILQLDVVGDEVSLTAWAEGQTKPNVPQLSFRDRSLPTGTVAITADSDGTEATVIYRWFEVAPILPGDVNIDDQLTVSDIDLLSAAMRDGLDSKRYDANRDGTVDAADRQFWVVELNDTFFGDANLDGQFNSLDLVQVLQAAQYDDGIASNSTWATGDWNGDGDFDREDLVLALQDGGFGEGPRLALTTVPEPSTLLLVASAILCIVALRCRR